MAVIYKVEPGGKLAGTIRVPGDKSISHRAVMLGSIADGTTEVTGFLTGEDCLSTMKAFQAMGVKIEQVAPTHLRIHGAGAVGLQRPAAELDLGNSGTSMRLMTGLLSAQKFPTTLTGDASLSRRPMKRIIEPLQQMGAAIEAENGRAPLRISPVASLQGITYRSPVASAQVKSGIVLAGLFASGATSVHEPHRSRDHTERMLQAFGARIDRADTGVSVQGGQKLRAARIEVPADISSAAFFMVGAAVTPGAEIVLQDVGINPTRTGVIDILRSMGAQIALANQRSFGNEPVADLHIRGGALRGVAIDPAVVASAIDEFPAIFVAAAFARGETVLTGAEELRVKESDRIQTMCEGLRALGISAVATRDGMRIVGGRMRGGTVDSRGDHRVAMSFAMAGLRAEQPIRILDCANVNTSFPGFADLARGAGIKLQVS
jgi:3-phosphoshikimate 1-carboxyvinyltransferase